MKLVITYDTELPEFCHRFSIREDGSNAAEWARREFDETGAALVFDLERIVQGDGEPEATDIIVGGNGAWYAVPEGLPAWAAKKLVRTIMVRA